MYFFFFLFLGSISVFDAMRLLTSTRLCYHWGPNGSPFIVDILILNKVDAIDK